MAALSSSDTVAVIGAGTMGAGIAQVAAKAGHPVLLFDAMMGAAQVGKDKTAKGLSRLVEKGKMTQDDVDALLDRISVVEKLEDLAPAKLVIEAIVENIDIKQDVFGKLEEICSEDTIMASNTSSISLTAIGAKLKRSSNLAGMHFFNPAPIMQLVEVISGLTTSKEVADCLYETSLAWGKKPVHAKSTPGFIVNRVARPFYAEALRVVEEGGADVVTLDTLLKQSGGFRMGPFELMDLIGHDVNYAVTTTTFAQFYNDPRFLPSLVQKELVDGGLLGRKTGRGFYDYGADAEQPVAQTASQGLKPGKVIIEGDLGPAEPLVQRMMDSGLDVERIEMEDSMADRITIGHTHLMLTPGVLATELEASLPLGEDNEALVLFDLSIDFATTERIAIAPSETADDEHVSEACGFFQALGIEVSVMQDVPGLINARTIAMIINEAADTVYKQVCSVQDVDLAMQKGVNYPKGPLAWADEIGPDYIASVIENLGRTYGEDRYRTSLLLRRKVNAGKYFHD
ncbi:3-hydroxyacyl-CoA dehydrogenase [Terasakiella sp. SH-1]|uniref:3-hydroxyacyl-CoA dehydrogenase n=1 Tax=Terasakiella sp. SH-1 TaxID=2560057 RepID=UPI0010734267|nr:3-hydroxyacyl-CoA dehydrogenase [Terasakiella sp. SH-1]